MSLRYRNKAATTIEAHTYFFKTFIFTTLQLSLVTFIIAVTYPSVCLTHYHFFFSVALTIWNQQWFHPQCLYCSYTTVSRDISFPLVPGYLYHSRTVASWTLGSWWKTRASVSNLERICTHRYFAPGAGFRTWWWLWRGALASNQCRPSGAASRELKEVPSTCKRRRTEKKL